jgi:hypothetical protein
MSKVAAVVQKLVTTSTECSQFPKKKRHKSLAEAEKALEQMKLSPDFKDFGNLGIYHCRTCLDYHIGRKWDVENHTPKIYRSCTNQGLERFARHGTAKRMAKHMMKANPEQKLEVYKCPRCYAWHIRKAG